jgi:hypothetical protein
MYGMNVLDPNWFSHNYEEEIRWMHFSWRWGGDVE